MGTNFPAFPNSIGFAAFDYATGNWWGNPYISHVMNYSIGLESNEKNVHTMGKVWASVSQVLPIRWVLLHFPLLWEIEGKTYAFPMCWSIPQDGNRMEKKYPYYGKSVSTNLEALAIRWLLLHFPVPWEIDEKNDAFPK